MKVAFDLESKTIQISVSKDGLTTTDYMTPDEAMLFADMIRSMATTLHADLEPKPVGPLTRQSMGYEAS